MFEKRILYFLVFLGMVLYGVFLTQTDQGFFGETLEASSSLIGKQAPDFKLHSEDGTELKLSDLQGKVVLLHFWASWCGPCAEEFSSLAPFVDQFKDQGFVIVALSLDEDKSDVAAFRKKVKFNFPVYFDPAGGDVADRYGTYRLPESYLINKQGIITRKAAGPQNWSVPAWKMRVQELI